MSESPENALPEPLKGLPAATFDRLLAEVMAQAESLSDTDVTECVASDGSEIDSRAFDRLATLTHSALALRPSAEREELIEAWSAGDTMILPIESPRGRDRVALLVIVAGRPIVLADLAELLPGDDLV